MDEVASSEGPQPRSVLGLLVSRDFGRFFAARLSTSIGVWIHGVVAAIAAFESTGSAFVVGLISFVQFFPQLVFGLHAGALTDRGDIRRQMLLGRFLSGIGSVSLAAWYALPIEASEVANVSVLGGTSFAVGLGLVIGGPAMQSATPALVSKRELPAAMALNTAPLTIGRIVGPALGALTTVGFGFELSFLIAGLANILFMILIYTIIFPTPSGRDEQTDEQKTIKESIRFVRANRPVLLSLVGVTALGFGSEPTVTLAPPLAATLGGGTSTVGYLSSAMGVGAGLGVVLSSVLAGKVRQDRAAPVGMILMALAFGACAFPLSAPLALLAFGVAGFGFIVSVSSLSIIMQLRLPALLRGRIMALWLMGFIGSRPLGALLVGGVADTLNIYAAFVVVSVTLIAAAIACRPSRLRDDNSGSGSPRGPKSH